MKIHLNRVKKAFIVLLSVFLQTVAYGQTEFFVRLDTATCNYIIIDSISGVKWIALSTSFFDKTNKRYYFKGEDTSSSFFLYGIDATNGNIISNPQFTSNIGEIKFDNSTGNLYGLYVNGSTANTHFVSINPTNLNYTIIGSNINLTTMSNEATIDEVNHRFIFPAGDSAGNNCLFSIDIASGNIISKPILNLIQGFQFDNSSGNLYGVKVAGSPPKGTFNLINPSSGNITFIDSINADLSGGGSLMGYYTFDEIKKRYTFCGIDANNLEHLCTLDATNGQIISNCTFLPNFSSTYNVIETKYDNSAGTLYALHWGFDTLSKEGIIEQNKNNAITIFPNPSSSIFNIQSEEKLISAEVYSVYGEKVFEHVAVDKPGEMRIDFSKQRSGIYLLQLKTAEGTAVKKIVVQK